VAGGTIRLDSRRTRRTAVDRRADRLVAVVAMAIALAFLCAAVVAAFLPTSLRVGSWLPLHLALAGGASTAIVGVMPFFSAAFATTQPVDARLRWASLLAVTVGALVLPAGYVTGDFALAALGGGLFIVGMLVTAYATVVPVRRPLARSGGVVTLGYTISLLMVASGALLASLFLAGVPAVVGAWGGLRPAHAWLNLVGFVSLVIATTLLHFFPTVIGARIQDVRSAYLTVLGLAAGTALVAVGFAARSDWLVRAGAGAVLVGALALAVYAWQTWRTKSAWSGDEGWHRFAMGGLLSAIAWFEVGALTATVRLLAAGADPAAASADVLIGPLVPGWVGLAVLASATHLVPAIGPGDPAAHTRQRVLLGHLGGTRLLVADAGIASLALGIPASLHGLVVAGMLLAGLSLGGTAVLLVASVIAGLRSARRAGNLVA
jgi:nitrite reductase (NO-forming)